jgi:hypothetical protein
MSRQLKFGIIFATAYGFLIALMFVDSSLSITGRAEVNLSDIGLLFLSVIVTYMPMRIGLINNRFSDCKFYIGLFLTGLLVFGIGVLVGHIISLIVRRKNKPELRP